MAYSNVYELASKADWEGGITEMLYGYGIDIDDLPSDTPLGIVEDFKRALAAAPAINRISEWLDEALQTGDPED